MASLINISGRVAKRLLEPCMAGCVRARYTDSNAINEATAALNLYSLLDFSSPH